MNTGKFSIVPRNLYMLTLLLSVGYMISGEIVFNSDHIFFTLLSYFAAVLMTIQLGVVFPLYSLGGKLLILFSLLLSVIVGVVNGGYYQMLATCALVFGAKGQDFKTILNYYFSVGAFICICMILLSMLGFARDKVNIAWERENLLLGGSSIRHSFGYVWPTNFATHVFYILMSLWIVKSGKLTKSLSIIYLLISFLIIVYTDSRLGAGCIVLLVLASVFLKKRKHTNTISKKYLISLVWIPLLALGIFLLTVFYDSSDINWVVLDALLTGRLRISQETMNEYGISTFGNFIVMYGGDTSGQLYNFIDSSYLQLIILYGTIYTFLYLLAYLVLAYKAYNRRDRSFLIAIIIAGVSGAISQHFIQIFINPLLLALTANHDTSANRLELDCSAGSPTQLLELVNNET